VCQRPPTNKADQLTRHDRRHDRDNWDEIGITVSWIVMGHDHLTSRGENPVYKLLGASLVLAMSGNANDTWQCNHTRSGIDDPDGLTSFDRAENDRILNDTEFTRPRLYAIHCRIIR
jgi:hypothetical protein